MELLARIFILIHAICGGIALISGAIALGSSKGKKLHRQFGKLFYYSMLTTAQTALIVSVLPNHHNPFLFSIGVFSLYLTLIGYRTLGYKRFKVNLQPDRFISGTMLLVGLGMLIIPPIIYGKLIVLFLVFGTVGAVMATIDLYNYRRPAYLKQHWLPLHIGKITGAYISAVTAFVVVNEVLPSLVAWLLPGIIGSIFISISIARVKKKQQL